MRTIFIFLVIVLAACNKTRDPGPDNRKFSGVVLDYTTGQPVANAVVKIIRVPAELPGEFTIHGIDPGLIRNMKTDLFRNIRVDSMVTNNNGHYEMELNASQPPFYRYMVAAYREGYIHPYHLPAIHFMDSTSFQDTTYLDKNSYVHIVVNNDPPAESGDTLGLRTFYLDSLMQYAYHRYGTGDSASFFGPVSQGILMDTVSARAFPKVKVVWTFRNGNLFTKDSVLVDLQPFGITEVQVNY